ncbi:septal ring lytic transglycosylase RlpA family protein [bacterium]|nr:septal ring lytic transglycosylase RlpA family protein [bacterium]
MHYRRSPGTVELNQDAQPRSEPLHRFANNPYQVFGKDYVPQRVVGTYRERGIASWYGRRYHGQKTSNGEIYDMYAMTAAHPTLPIPSYARVTSVSNGRSVIVRINDRGPFHSDRVIDLSYVAAFKLGYVQGGSTLVDVESLMPNAAPPVASAPPKPVPVPAEPGQPSVIKHVVYIIKENRTYDQVLGDLGKGNGEPKLCIFPRKITPNHHAIADRFPLLDNYYCNGVNSSDGHAWGTQGIVGPYREKDRVGYRCGYDFGTDALFYAGCGFLWDHALLGGKSFRNYGEMDYTVKLKGKTYADFFGAWQKRDGKAVFATSYQIETLRKYSSKDFPGWEMAIPDQVRADVFLKELAEFEQKGSFPDLTIIYLPNDHTAAELTPNSYLADNDLALGRVVEGLSRSRFWGEMAIFVNEDDPQTGGDHVDGHRSFCFVISPWAKRGAVISKFYNQTSVLHTMCRILGLQPLNQVVAASPTMEDCFAEQADLEPFKHLVPSTPLNEARPKPKAKTAGWLPTRTSDELVLARMERMDFSRPDLIHEDTLNRAIWTQTRPGERYPAEWAGPHGRGLAALGLVLDPELDDDDD